MRTRLHIAAPLTGAILVLALVSMPASAAVAISTAATTNMSCLNGICTPTAKDAVLNAGDLTSMLASGNVEVTTGSGSLAAKVEDIDVAAGFNWRGANSLTLDAYRSVTFRSGSVADDGTGGVSLVTNDGGSNGALSFHPGANLTFASTSNSLTINGAPFTLENSIAILANAIAANPSGNFALADSYDASQDGNYHSSPISTPLQGVVEGLGNIISNLSINVGPTADRPGTFIGVGLFSQTAKTATIADLTLTKLEYRGLNSYGNNVFAYAGGLVGGAGGRLTNDRASGSIYAGQIAAGGLAGTNSGIISSSHASVSIRSDGGVAGGLVADAYGDITLSSADGDVLGASVGGGLAAISSGTIDRCFASGRVATHGSALILGGLAGAGGEKIVNSYATGPVKSGNWQIGGLVGGASSGSYEYSYSTGFISRYGSGFMGYDDNSSITSSYWNTTTSKTSRGVGEGGNEGHGSPAGLTSTELRSGLPVGFDPTIWAEKKSVNHGFPYLINNPPPKD